MPVLEKKLHVQLVRWNHIQLGWLTAWCVDSSGDYHGRQWAALSSRIQSNLFIANTSEIQPCDQGIIKTMKTHYRKNMLQCLITAIKSGSTVNTL